MQLSIITATYNRGELLASRALTSLVSQSSTDFEWVVINDGRDAITRQVVEDARSRAPFSIKYEEFDHNGYGLGKARNLGLSVSSGDFVAYLDDDNLLYPKYVAYILDAFKREPEMQYCFPIQERRRDVVENGIVSKKGRPFHSVKPEATLPNFIDPKLALFDSNGFVHRKDGSPSWNETLRVYIDYEFFLKCVSTWGIDRGTILREILIEYVQTNEGIIGQSSYEQWAQELQDIYLRRQEFAALQNTQALEGLTAAINYYSELAHRRNRVEAFDPNPQSRL